MQPFPRRHFHGVGDVIRSLRDILASVRARQGPVRQSVETAFRQRLWLAVTYVNDCRYCFWVHTRWALSAGVPGSEVEALCAGRLTDSPPEQRAALLYARQWAERERRPDPEERARLVEAYGEKTVRAFETVLQVIHFANMTGNTWDLILYKLSGGRREVNRHFRSPVTGRSDGWKKS